MYKLRIGQDWASEIAQIRNEQTEDTNLIRFDNAFHRICRDEPGTFEVSVLPGLKHLTDRGVGLTLRVRDLYVTRIDGHPFEQYAKTLDRVTPQAMGLENRLRDLSTAHGTKLFEAQSVIVLCVAESLRSDHTATSVEQLIRATTVGLVGAPTRLPIADLLRSAHAWGQTSDSIFDSLSPQARNIVRQPRASLSAYDRKFSERVDVTKIDPDLREFANTIKVLKRPT